VLLDGNRYTVACPFAVVVFVACAGIGVAGYIPVADPDTATTLVAAIVGGTLPFIPSSSPSTRTTSPSGSRG